MLEAVSLLLHTEIVRLQAAFTLTLPAPTKVRFVGSTVSLSVMLPVFAVALTVLLSSAPEPLMLPAADSAMVHAVMAECTPMSPDVVVSDTLVGDATPMHPLTHMPLEPVTDSAPHKQI